MTAPTTLLATFIHNHARADFDQRMSALEAAVRTGFGTWMSPDCDPATNQYPATHQHEITVFGIAASGLTARAAVANWFKIATTQTLGENMQAMVEGMAA